MGNVHGRVQGKVAFITGAARGQGRSHALRLAQEGADIIAVDVCGPIESVKYAPPVPADLDETVALVEQIGRRAVGIQADVRDYDALAGALSEGVDQMGGLHIVCANAGIVTENTLERLDERTWQDMLDINLTGVWHTFKAAIPHLRESGGGSIIATSSHAGLRGMPTIGHYSAAKHGVVGLVRSLALELAPEMIRVNSIHPTNVKTDMIMNEQTFALFAPDLPPAERTLEAVIPRFQEMQAMPIPWVETSDISNAVLWLASDEARYVTGVALPVDAGSSIK